MEKIIVNTTEVILGSNIDINKELIGYNKIFVVTDSNVEKLYLNKINYSDCFVIKAGEESKNISTYESIVNNLISKDYTREDLIVSLGGGVVSDITGFVASTYKRGMKYIAIPTTLLSMVDASIGGKNGINLNEFKNELGSFYNPIKTIIDINFLDTLSNREYKNGLAEVIKYAAIFDKDLFNKLSSKVDESIIKRCIEIKKSFVEKDYLDKGERKALNFGHTLAHAIEKDSSYSVLHGEAVAKGMILITYFSEKFNLTLAHTVDKLKEKLNECEINFEYSKGIEELKEYIKKDKKVKDNTIDIVVLSEIGSYKIVNINLDLLK